MRFNNLQSTGGGKEFTQPLPASMGCSSSTSDCASFSRCVKIFASTPYSLSTTNSPKIPAKSNQEIRGTFKHNKKEPSLNQSHLWRHLRGIKLHNLPWRRWRLWRGVRETIKGTVLDNVGLKCHTINYYMIEDGAAVGTAVQLQTEGIMDKLWLRQVQIGNFHISRVTQEQQQLSPAPYIPNYRKQTRKWSFVFHNSKNSMSTISIHCYFPENEALTWNFCATKSAPPTQSYVRHWDLVCFCFCLCFPLRLTHHLPA